MLGTALGAAVLAVVLSGCEICETKATITLDNTRLWCNCEVDFPNGDEYIIFAGEAKTLELTKGSYLLKVDCGNAVFENNLCGFEEGQRENTFEADCDAVLYWELNW